MPGLKLPLTKLSTILAARTALIRKLQGITAGLALVLVAAAAIALAAGNSDLANLIVTYAYGFFAAGVIIYLIQYIRELRKGSGENENSNL